MAHGREDILGRRMAHCFVTRALPGTALERLAAEHDVEVWQGELAPGRRDLVGRAAEAEGLLCLLTDRVDADLITSCSSLRAISNYAVGWDNVDVAAATARGIPVGHTPDVLTEATADFTFALMLAAARRVLEAYAFVRTGHWLTWQPGLLLGHDVHGATLGIIGFGRIGKALARRAEGFGMTVIHTSRSSGVPLEELLERSDFVAVHAPLTPETEHLIDEAALQRMKPTAILVNTSRGAIIDTSALEKALREGWIAGAALDVTDPEPLPVDHPLSAAPNLLLSPHVASASHGAREAMADLAVDNLLAGLAGERMPRCVNPEVYERSTRPAP